MSAGIEFDSRPRDVIFVDAPRPLARDYLVLVCLVALCLIGLWVILSAVTGLDERFSMLIDTFGSMSDSCRGVVR